MTDDLAPAPPADLATRDLHAETLAAGSLIHRLHETINGAKFFGTKKLWRFDDPTGVYGIMYAGLTQPVAFAETLLRSGTVIALSELDKRSFSALELVEPLILAPLYGSALVGLGATAAVAAGPYANSQAWSQAIHAHPSAVDGIIYRSARDNDDKVVALFDRAAHKVEVRMTKEVTADPSLLAQILDRYNAGIF